MNSMTLPSVATATATMTSVELVGYINSERFGHVNMYHRSVLAAI